MPFAELQTDLKKTDDACKKIKLAVANIAKNRSKFAHVDDAELESRQAAITELEKVSVVFVTLLAAFSVCQSALSSAGLKWYEGLCEW